MDRPVDEPVVTRDALASSGTLGPVADRGELVRVGPPRSEQELFDTLSHHGLLADPDVLADPEALEKKLREFYRAETLTPREVEILRFAAEGMTTEQTAEWLEISRETVRTHRMNIMRKLHVHTLTGAVGVAYRSGILR